MTKKTLVTIYDPWLGEREIPHSALAVIVDQYKLLCKWRDERGVAVTPHLLQDIRVYKYILDSKTPEKLADDYFKKKNELLAKAVGNFPVIKKIAVAAALGWDVK